MRGDIGMLPMLTAANYYCDDMNVNMVIADRLLTWQQTEVAGAKIFITDLIRRTIKKF